MMIKQFLKYIICLSWMLLAIACSTGQPEPVSPEIINPGLSRVTISWFSKTPDKGRIYYKPAASGADFLSVIEPFDKTRQHEITITNLQPGTFYTYRIGKKGKTYQFQTRPAVNSPFSFLVVYGDLTKKIAPLTMTEVFDFYLHLNPGKIAARSGWFAESRAYVPVYTFKGLDSLYQQHISGSKIVSGVSWKLDWAGLRLIFIDHIQYLPPFFATPSTHTFGVVTVPSLVDMQNIANSELHKQLKSHNHENPAHPASFVWILGDRLQNQSLDTIQYMMLPVQSLMNKRHQVIRVDVDVESSRALFIDGTKEITLRQPPLKGKRSCEECRRLADKGAYEESIKAYKEFIRNNNGHFQIDDAYLAIAEIYDEKLFKFNEAVSWYEKLFKEYPHSSLTPLAKQRMKFLERFSDHGYKPLERFERIRKIDFSRQQGQQAETRALLKKVESLLKQFPLCKLAPVMQYWLANRYRSFSTEQAVAAYYELSKKYPASKEAREVLMEIGETFYDAGRFEEAFDTYLKARLKLPDQLKTIDAQLKRATRNIRRKQLAVLGWIITLFIFLVVLVWKPIGFNFSNIRRYFWVVPLLVVIFSFASWLIHEQFTSAKEGILLALLPALVIGTASFLSTNFTYKISSGFRLRGRLVQALFGSFIAILFFAAGFYLVIYYINSHYLILAQL